MTKKIDRRTFISESSRVALSTIVGGSMLPYLCTGALTEVQAAEQAAITVATGEN